MQRESLPTPPAEIAGIQPHASALRRAARWGALVAVALYFAVATGFLAVRYVVLPNAGEYRDEVARRLSDALGLRVTIGGIDAHWQGLHPQLGLVALRIHDREGRPALDLDYVIAEPAWSSFATGRLDLRRLEVFAPRLAIRREADGAVYVAGIQLRAGDSGGGLSEWLLAQPRLIVRDAAVEWTDALRNAPTLALERVNLRLENSGRRHRLGITADPPRDFAAPLDLRADLSGDQPGNWSQWSGEAYVQLDHADLSAWHQWVDYPVDLPRGAGALRLWLRMAPGRIESLTGDVALSDVALRLRADLPMLELDRLAGRVTAKLGPAGFEISGRRMSLVTRSGIDLPAADYQLTWSGATGAARSPRGALSASRLDLDALARLAAFLPLDDEVRARIAAYAPGGAFTQVKANWEGDGWPSRYELSAGFERLSIKPVGLVPGFDGFSGQIEANQKAGSLTLAGREASVYLPRVFPEPRISLKEGSARVFWTLAGGTADVQLQNISFANDETAGTAFGRYRTRPDGPGEIDLTAQLAHAEGTAVWRYLPFVVGAQTREWVRSAIAGGRADGARLRLKGDLAEFPFDGKRAGAGLFEVTSKVTGVTLRYATNWPEIRNLSGDLLFEGVRMQVRTRGGGILGARLGPVSADIPDLNAWEPLLRVQGSASGPTSEFLRFVDESPVAAQIDHYNEGVVARGDGTLQLKLALPLGNLGDSRIEGEYRFAGNTIWPGLLVTPLTDASGTVAFTGNSLNVRGATAQLYGMPIGLTIATRPEGVQFDVAGTMSAVALRRELDWPWLEHLSGASDWRARILVRGKTAAVTLESSLQGMSSSLPEPFNKVATDRMDLKLERSLDETVSGRSRERVRVRIGDTLNAVLMLRRGADRSAAVEQAAIGVRAQAELPPRGVALAANLERLNIDHWRRLLAAGGAGGAPVLESVSLRAGELTAFGQGFADLSLRAELVEGIWLAQVSSREMAGELSWRSQGRGRLRARLNQLSLADVSSPQPVTEARVEDGEVRELPGLDVVAEQFSLKGRSLGRLELQAVNRGTVWQIDRLSIVNPESTLSGSGQWTASAAAANTQLAFGLEVSDVGKLLERLGYPETVRRGAAQLEGKVSWSGAPTGIDFATLDGSLEVKATKGQFNKLDPGVGRVLGILSLQSLPRRITLDFRDVFTEGFAFDSISGSIKATRGVLASEGLLIQGPAAKVRMSGTVSLPSETQDLRVRVQPSIGDSVAIGAALVNPVVGVVTLLAQKVLKDPIDQIFAYDYAVTGSWADPRVEKLGAAAAKEAGDGR